MNATPIKITATIEAPVEKVWEFYTSPLHIVQWNQASPDWHCPFSENDLKKGGHFKHTMAAKDGSYSFDFSGTYEEVSTHRLLEYTLEDGRKIKVVFDSENSSSTLLQITFEAENQNSVEMQKQGWESILQNFKSYTERKI